MNAITRLALFAAALAVVFGATFFTATAIAPERTGSSEPEMNMSDMPAASAHTARGTSQAEGGYQLGAVSAPTQTDSAGTLSFQITAADGTPLTTYTESHEKQLHLIVVRSDGAQFRHVHPELDNGVWSLPWTWTAAGTYRVYADFVPTDGEAMTLTRTVDVAGTFTPVPQNPTTTASVDGFDVKLTGGLDTGLLRFEFTRDGKPVTDLEPYLGAFGHLVALRQGDLAYLHVHPETSDPGPDISFASSAPTNGRYLLYLDFKADGKVHTANFVVDASGQTAEASHGGH